MSASHNIIRLVDVTVAYRAAEPLAGVSITIGPEPTAVVGPSGSGKSTLLRVVAGTQAPDSGTVMLGSTPVGKASWSTGGDARVAVVHQDHRLVPFLTVSENMMLGAECRGRTCGRAEVAAVLAQVGLAGIGLDRWPDSLSGGEQQRVAIGRAVLSGAELLVADEPTGELDQETTDRVIDVLLRVADESAVQVLVATHDARVAERLSHVVRVAGGAVVAER